jgi:hypothetical protein
MACAFCFAALDLKMVLTTLATSGPLHAMQSPNKRRVVSLFAGTCRGWDGHHRRVGVVNSAIAVDHSTCLGHADHYCHSMVVVGIAQNVELCLAHVSSADGRGGSVSNRRCSDLSCEKDLFVGSEPSL